MFLCKDGGLVGIDFVGSVIIFDYLVGVNNDVVNVFVLEERIKYGIVYIRY